MDYTYNGESLPAISVSASRSKEGKVHISLVNIDSKKDNKVEIDLTDLDLGEFTARFTSKNLQDHNTFENTENIEPAEFKDFKLKKGKLEVELPPFSVVVL